VTASSTLCYWSRHETWLNKRERRVKRKAFI